MNKNKIVMGSIGGVAAVAALVLGYLTYAAWEEKVENEDTLEGQKANVKRLSNAKIAPSAASVKAIEENHKTLAIWFDKAFDVASRGDKAFPRLTVAEFCNQLREEAIEKRALPGGVNGKLVDEDFAFGFRELSEGSLPKPETLPTLQRQWDDIKLFVDTLATNGAVQLVSVEKSDVKAAEEQPRPAPPPPRGRNTRQQQVEEKPLADAQTYTIVFLARPLALVKTINEFARTERFIVVDSLVFERATDALGDALGGKDKEEARPSRGRGRGRGRGRASEEEASAEGESEVRRKGLVVDPVTDVPFTVTMKITTYDFGTKASGEAAEAGNEGEEEQK